MPLPLRTVTASIKKPNGSAWANAPVTFTPFAIVNVEGVTVPIDPVTVTTDSNGAISAPLYTLTGSFLRYFVDLPSGEKYQIDVPDGAGSIDLATMLATALVTTPADSLSLLLASKANIASPEFTGTPSAPKLKLLDKNYTSFLGANTTQYLSLGTNTRFQPNVNEDLVADEMWLPLTLGGSGMLTIGRFTHFDIQGNPANPTIYGDWVSIFSNSFAPTGTSRIYGAYRSVDIGFPVSEAFGGWFSAASGSSGASGADLIVGVAGTVGVAHNGNTDKAVAGDFLVTSSVSSPSLVTDAFGLRVRAKFLDNVSATNLFGLRFTEWSKTGAGQIQNNAVIYVDSSVNIGVSNHVIKSESTAPSELAGPLSVPADPYDLETWEASLEVPTKGDVSGKIEEIASPYPQSSRDIRRSYNSFYDCWNATGLADSGFVVINSQSGMYNSNLPNYANFPNAAGVLIWQLRTSATNAGGIVERDQSSTISRFGMLGRGIVKTRNRFSFLALSDATNSYTVRSGVADLSNTITPANGVFFRYNDAVNGGKWQAVCMAGGVETAADTGVAAAVDGMHTFMTEVNAAGTQAKFYIDDALVSTITTNIPTAAPVGAVWHWMRSAGTADIQVLATDYCWSEWNFTNPR